MTTSCKVNMATKEVFDIEVSTEVADGLDVLEEQYITIDGEDFDGRFDRMADGG